MKKFGYMNFTVETTKDIVTMYYNGETEIHNTFNEAMNELGNKGWELVSVVYIPTKIYTKMGLINDELYCGKTVHYFKREMTDDTKKVYAKREQLQDQISDIDDIDKLINLFKEQGYQIKFQHRLRIIFGKGMEEVRFDYDENSHKWVEHK